MARSNSSFKMKKTTKYLLANKFKTPELRAHYKKMMIDAQVSEEKAQRTPIKDKPKDE